MKRLLISILLAVGTILPVAAQIDTTFWFAAPYMSRHSEAADFHFVLFAYDQPVKVRVSMPADPSFRVRELTIAADSAVEIPLAANYNDAVAHLFAAPNQISPRAILVEADHIVGGYYQITHANSEAYTLKGRNALGVDFRMLMQNRFRNAHNLGSYRDAYASAEVLATEDSTVVQFYPAKGEKLPDGSDSLVVTLMRGEVYCMRAKSKQPAARLDGMKIRANKPIAVNSSDDTATPDQRIAGEDASGEQLIPTDLAGEDYIVLSQLRPWEGCFLQAIDDTTHITMGNGQVLTIYPGERSTFVAMDTIPALYLHGDAPFLVWQLTGVRSEFGATVLPPVYCTGSNYVRYRRQTDSQATRVNIFLPANGKGALSINGYALPDSMYLSIPGTEEWLYATISSRHFPYTPDNIISISSGDVYCQVGLLDYTGVGSQRTGISRRSATYGYFSDFYHAEYTSERDTIYEGDTLQWHDMALTEKGQYTIHALTAHHCDSIVQLDLVVLPLPVDTLPIDTLPKDTLPKDTLRRHHFALYMSGGYAALPFQQQEVSIGWGYGLSAGIAYEYQNRSFLLQLGAGVGWQDAEHVRKEPYLQDEPRTDTQHGDYTLRYTIRRADRARRLEAEILLLMGQQIRSFYYLMGLRAGFTALGNTEMQANYTTTAIYDQYFSPLHDMADHGLRTMVPVIKHGDALPYRWDARGHVELGMNVHISPIADGHLGLFAEYGILPESIGKNYSGELYEVLENFELHSYPMNHALLTRYASGKWVQSLYTGLRFTVVF